MGLGRCLTELDVTNWDRETTPVNDDDGVMSLMVSRRFDGWVSANVALAAVARPRRRWRPHPATPLMRRGVLLAFDEREYKADGTSRDPRPIDREHPEPRHGEEEGRHITT